jgi:hypoxanthine-DNA glycosylase
LRCFAPFADERSRVLVLGTMPGPTALEIQEYYGFPGNHFWKIIPAILGEPAPKDYAEKKALLKKRRIALWDVIGTCTREGALDSAIRRAAPNDIPALLEKFPGIHAIFLNGKTAEALYRKYFGGVIHLVAHALPSTSPAYASMTFEKKREGWKKLLPYLENRNPWC